MEASGVYRDLDALVQQYSRERLSAPRGSIPSSYTPPSSSPMRSPPCIPEVHQLQPGIDFSSTADNSSPVHHQGVPSLTSRVPFYHVPGPCADNRRNLRLAATPHITHQQLHEVSSGLPRLTKHSPGVLCVPCGGSNSASWTLQDSGPGHRGQLTKARCVAVMLLATTLLLAAAALLVLFATVLGADSGAEWRTPEDEVVITDTVTTSDETLTEVHGEFLLSRERFNADMADPKSAGFRFVATQLNHQLDELFARSELGSEYNGSTVTSLQRTSGVSGVVVRCLLLLRLPPMSAVNEGEPANRVGLAFLRGLKHHEGRMWLGHFEVDVRSISFSGRRMIAEVATIVTAQPEAGWASWTAWSDCGPGGVRSRTRQCALDGGSGSVLLTSERCLVRGGGDLQVRDCHEDQATRELPTLLAVRDLTQNAISEPPEPVRLCDDCAPGEVCVALLGEQVPSCRMPKDHTDPTGCGGLCRINVELCHQLDKDAFRCMDDSRCLETEWRCGNKLCIPRTMRCDGYMNCYDHTDEYNCECNLLTHFRCGNQTACLPLSKRCDGIVDCWDASDERNCTAACPSPAHFTCSNGECIPQSKFCDSYTDCQDKSDEPIGCRGNCRASEFRCRNGRCVSRHTVCDTFDTCGDGSDEEGCADPSRDDVMTLKKIAAKEREILFRSSDCRKKGKFQCATGDCIQRSLVCDGADDCGDASDERKCPASSSSH